MIRGSVRNSVSLDDEFTKVFAAFILIVPQSGATATLTVNVHAVPCEELTSNNKATYTVVFG